MNQYRNNQYRSNQTRNNRSQSVPPYSYQEQPPQPDIPQYNQSNRGNNRSYNNRSYNNRGNSNRANNRRNQEPQSLNNLEKNLANENNDEFNELMENNNNLLGNNNLDNLNNLNNNNNNLNNNNKKNNNKNNNKKEENNNKEENNKKEENENKKNNTNQKNNKLTTEKVSEMASGMFNKASELASDAQDNDTLMLVFKILLGILFFVVLVHIVKYFYLSYEDSTNNNPWLIEGTKNAKHALVISQNPEHTNYVPIKRSDGLNGIEFTYSFWFLVDDFGYKQGEWKHLFHKGSPTSYPNRSPGVWLHPNTNNLRVYMNTLKEPLEYVDIENIPLRKWIHMTIILRNKVMEVYLNGFIKKRKEFDSLPRQNNGDVWVNLFGGFEGYVSNMRYFSHAISASDIDRMISLGPSAASCIDTGEKPPYFEDRWWF